MKRKESETLPKVDRFAEAGKKAGVSLEEFRLWMLQSLRGISPKQWSSWETGRRPIPDRYIVTFLRWKYEKPGATAEAPSPSNAIEQPGARRRLR